MKLSDIVAAIESSLVNITAHARFEAQEDHLSLEEVFYSTVHGEIIEDYPTDKPYPSCLIYGKTEQEEPVHSVWAYASDRKIAVLVTVYRPDPARWINWKERRSS